MAQASILIALWGCSTASQYVPEPPVQQSDIHERLSEAIRRDGFGHVLRSQRDGINDYDIINISISLDSLKGRHLSLEKLMTDIGGICAHRTYTHLPIRILIGAGDDEDQAYLFAILATSVKGRANVELTTATNPSNEIIVTVRRPSRGGR